MVRPPLRVFVSDREVYEALASRFAQLTVKATAVGFSSDGKWSGSRYHVPGRRVVW